MEACRFATLVDCGEDNSHTFTSEVIRGTFGAVRLPSRYLRRSHKQACRHDSSTTMEVVFTAGPWSRIVKIESVSPEGFSEGT
ncbi:hypothetical protein MTO96_023295 [Rhipicephalus appendiculatus]